MEKKKEEENLEDKKKENVADKKKEEGEVNKRRKEENYEEKKIVMRVGQWRETGKGSEILNQLSVSPRAESVLRVNLDLRNRFCNPNLMDRVSIIFFRKKTSPVDHYYEFVRP